MTMTLRFYRSNNLIFYLRILWVTTFVPTTLCFSSFRPDLNWIFYSKMIIPQGKIDLNDGAQMFEICIHNHIFLVKNTSSYINLEENIETSLYVVLASDVPCKLTSIYIMLAFAGLSVSILFIGIMLVKTRRFIGMMLVETRREVRTIVNGKFGLCDGCQQKCDIVRLELV
ncbi:uncharacterized protein LOC132718799 isoform X2 [Ruditapes philippinarum]|uniref:uncharacterized protein LOC132718799 isoform X2 n=1 Tax=Ruditapes philippinarum TaxID=129788 RepID=UPI00295C1084|nr:uncharacterized protein LOC132718799 isoform X2 [Ruditapes philippinarum]